MTAKVTSKGRVTLPKAVRDLLGIKPGDVIDFERAPDGRINPLKSHKTAKEFFGNPWRKHADIWKCLAN